MIDENVLDDGKYILDQMRGFLRRDGFMDPDLGYVGGLVRPRRDIHSSSEDEVKA